MNGGGANRRATAVCWLRSALTSVFSPTSPSTLLDPDTVYLERHRGPQVKGSAPQVVPPADASPKF